MIVDWWKSLKKGQQVRLIVAILGIFSIFGGSVYTGYFNVDSIHVGDEITYEYDEEKLTNLARSLAQDYRQQDAETIKELEKTIKELSRLDEAKYKKQEALDALNQGRTEEAERIFELIALEAKRKRSAFDKKKQYWIQEEADAQRRIGSLAFLHDTQKALAAYQRSTELDPNNKSGWNQLGHLYYRIGELSKAESAYETVLKLSEDDLSWQAIAYGNLGLVYRIHGELDKAIEFHEKSLAIDKELGRKDGMAITYGNLGLVYRLRLELDKAIEFHEKALAIHQELGSKEGLANTYSGLGLVYQIRLELDKAIEFHEKALAIYQELGIKEGMAVAYSNLGSVYRIRGELDKAIEFHEKALAINQELGFKEGMAITYGNLGSVYRIRDELDKAVEFWKKSLALFTEIGAAREMKQVQSLLDEVQH